MIEFIQVTKRYPTGKEALSGVNLKITPGEMIFVTGHSGAGKTSLLKLVSCIESPTLGSVMVDNMQLRKLSMEKVCHLRRKQGLILQNPMLLYDKTVLYNISLPLLVLGMRKKSIEKRVRSVLELVDLAGYQESLPQTLSSGQQQRVCIARAIVHRPDILLADEPTGNLDPQLAEEIMRLFCQLNKYGMTVMIATHDLNLINKLNYRSVILKNGVLC